MEYVNDAQGKTVTVASAGSTATEQPASVGGSAAPVSPNAQPPLIATSAAPAPLIRNPYRGLGTVTGTSTIEQLKDTYEREVARVEADAAAVKAFAASVLMSGKAEVAAVQGMSKLTKIGFAVFLALAFGLGISFAGILQRFT